MTTNSVWVVISADDAVDKLRDLIDKGYFSESQALVYELQSICDKVKKMVEAQGGELLLNTYERIVLEVPISVAEQMPNILEGYKQFFGSKLACGIGLTFPEASSAAKKSHISNEIELFDPKDPSFHEGSAFYKSFDDEEYQLPPNLFDPQSPPPEALQPEEDDYIAPPDAKTQLTAENAVIQAVVQQIGGQQVQQMQQAMMQQQQPQKDEQPRDLMEALHGEQIPGREAQLNENAGGNPEGAPPEEEEGEEGEGKESKSKEDGEGEESANNEQLGNLLATVKQQIPQLMQLADSNPDAYKQTMNLVHKLLAYAKTTKGKAAKKSELFTMTEELNKAIHLKLPVGSRKGKYKKVLVDGKEVWRQMSAGQVTDGKGQAISVKVSNARAAGGKPDVKPNG